MGEFELIQNYFAAGAAPAKGVVLGIGDDCALLEPSSAGQVLAVSIDTLVEGRHFLPGTPPEHLATRMLGAAVSDLAAMGATPAGFTLALTLPKADPSWLEPFSQALAQRARELEIPLIGGDTTAGPLTLTAQVQGWVDPQQVLTRNGAQVGDLVCVSGTLGDSHAGLRLQLEPEQGARLDGAERDYLQQRFYCPQPRLKLGQTLLGWASAAIDVSDGLLADLGHILGRSGVGAQVELTQLPLSAPLKAMAGAEALQWAASGGEDFELCFTLPKRFAGELPRLAERAGINLAIIGEIVAEEELKVFEQQREVMPAQAGFDHFGGAQ